MNKSFEKLYRDYEDHCKRVLRYSSRMATAETPLEKTRRIKDLEKDYTKWFKYYLAHYATADCSWYQRKMAKLMIEYKHIYLLLRIFRGGAKSVHANIGIPLFLYFVKNDLNFMLLIGENEIKAKKLLSDIQAELVSNARLENDYGKRFKLGDWAEGNFTTLDDVHFHALGIGQSPRGIRNMERRPEYISVDDVDTKKRSKNPKLVRELFEYLKEDIWGTYGSGNRRYIHCNNRFSKTSVIQMMSEHFEAVRKDYKERGVQPKHHIIVAKAIQDNGTSGWEENYSLEFWEELRKDIGERAFQREYQDNPIEEGTVFKNEWISWKKVLPLHQYDALIVYGDLSYKDNGDFKALLLVGKTGKEFHVIRSHVRRTTRALAAIWLYNLYEELNLQKFNIKYLVEGSFAQDMFVDDFDKEGDRRGYYIPVIADKKSKSNKQERIESMSGFFERGDVHFNIAMKGTADFMELEQQILAFEKGSQVNDDAPDCLQSAIQELNSAVLRFNVRTTSRKELMSRNKNRY
ncbi:MAG TPA: hypothetical protein PLP27_10245 [Crocinitomicaceae bacterium]|nr:hypothetical protein [Crocinitomicaceae bacterium]